MTRMNWNRVEQERRNRRQSNYIKPERKRTPEEQIEYNRQVAEWYAKERQKKLDSIND